MNPQGMLHTRDWGSREHYEFSFASLTIKAENNGLQVLVQVYLTNPIIAFAAIYRHIYLES